MTNPTDHAAKRFARLAAVQMLYQIALTQKPATDILHDFQAQPAAFLHEVGEGENPSEFDHELAAAIVSGVSDNGADLDAMIAGLLDARFSADRIEILLRSILRAGAFELYRHGEIPAGVIINDYVDVAHAFFDAKEPGLVNALLDKMAANLRAK